MALEYGGEWSVRERENGWTCPHNPNASGPCSGCHPGTGLCKRCSQPLDDHAHEGAVVACTASA